MAHQLKSLLDIDFDIDAYLATGGSLLNLVLMPSGGEKIRIELWLRTQGPEVRARVARVAEFIKRAGGLGPAPATITETKLCAIWRGTAHG
jgi:hypothetical protein